MIVGRERILDTNRIDSVFLGKFTEVNELPPSKTEIAFIGRSNSGKSSLLRALMNADKPPQISGTPGSTRAMQCFALNTKKPDSIPEVMLIDFPGYGYAKSASVFRKRFSQMLVHYLEKMRPVRAIFLMMDARRKPEEEELEIARIGKERRVPVMLCLNKADTLGQSEVAKIRAEYRQDETFFECILLSAKKKENLAYVQNFILSLKSQ